MPQEPLPDSHILSWPTSWLSFSKSPSDIVSTPSPPTYATIYFHLASLPRPSLPTALKVSFWRSPAISLSAPSRNSFCPPISELFPSLEKKTENKPNTLWLHASVLLHLRNHLPQYRFTGSLSFLFSDAYTYLKPSSQHFSFPVAILVAVAVSTSGMLTMCRALF